MCPTCTYVLVEDEYKIQNIQLLYFSFVSYVAHLSLSVAFVFLLKQAVSRIPTYVGTVILKPQSAYLHTYPLFACAYMLVHRLKKRQ